MPNDVSIARYIPPMSLPDIARLAEAIARSRLFGIQNVDQALALMAISQAEGRHPALAARDYDIIQGRPSKKSEAMLRDMLASGGTVEWHVLSDSKADATFSHPAGGTIRLSWDMERAKAAGIYSKDMWKKYPRQMLRARCISEGVRTVCPMATSGMYVPEEIRDSGPASKRRQPAPEAIEHEPAPPELETFDPDTGEVIDAAAIEQAAMEAASNGTDRLRAHLRGISREARALLNGKIGTREAPGELLRMAMRADDDIEGGIDPFDEPAVSPAGSPPTGATAAPPPAPAGEPDVSHLYLPLSDTPSENELTAWKTRIDEKLDDGAAPADIRRALAKHLDRLQQIDPLEYGLLMVKLTDRCADV